MKFVTVSDIHIGDYSYGSVDPQTGLGTRLLDFLQNLQQSIDFAIKNKVDAFIIPGDIYRVKNPSSKIRKCFAQKMKILISNGIRVIILTGNHDMTIASGGSHAMSEMEEISEFVEGLEIYSFPEIIKIKDAELYLLPFVNRGENAMMTPDDLLRFHVEKVHEFNSLTKKSVAKEKVFFGHFGTDRSIIGGSSDLDMTDSASELVVKCEYFDEGNWSKVYLGHIHKQQEFNDVVRHIGSLSRVDFAEEDEQKGFYFYEDGKDTFIKVNDRQFLTMHTSLLDQPLEMFNEFIAKIKKMDLRETIVRVGITIRQTDLPKVRFESLEDYLKKNSWHSLGVYNTKLIQEDVVETPETQISSSDTPQNALKKFMEKNPGRFSGIESLSVKLGNQILQELKMNLKG